MTELDRQDRAHTPAIAALIAAGLGGAVFGWAAGLRILDPREFGWVMQGDWRIHFLGWHFFRNEPWQWPPGVIATLYEPIGTTLGYTDSIPIVALLLKPIEAWLPDSFQYIGLWFLLCFVLQGFFGALVVSTWTPRPLLQIVGSLFYVFLPILLFRIAHPALCSQWLLLWALWLNWRRPSRYRNDVAQHVGLGLISGLVHPYLAVMVLALLGALAIRRLFTPDGASRPLAVLTFCFAAAALAAGWWASGLFTLTSGRDLLAAGGDFSTNLLSLVNPGPHSAFLPGFRFYSGNQWDGYQYFGLGLLLLCLVAAPIAMTNRVWSRRSIPLVVVLLGCTLYAITPLVAAGPLVLVDLREELAAVSVFRATGRFFWPVAYALVGGVIGIIATRLRPTIATVLLIGALGLQVADVHQWWWVMHNGARSREFFEWSNLMPSSEWRDLLPRYKHLRMYSPEFCRGPVPVAPTVAAYHAGLYGLGINDGFAARVDATKQAEACRQFRDQFDRGVIDDTTVYLIAPPLVEEFRRRTGDAAECREIDALTVCVSSRSAGLRQ
jgi:hypothetical protein